MEKIRIGVAHTGAGIAPLFAAVDGGYFREHGLEPELVSCPGHPRALQALISGEVDFINSVGAELILANLQHRGDAVVIASAISRSAQQVSARPGLTTREELRGKRWGVVARNDADECAIVMAFERWGWDIARDAQDRRRRLRGPAPRCPARREARRRRHHARARSRSRRRSAAGTWWRTWAASTSPSRTAARPPRGG